MARIRTIKPEFWTDARVGECSPSARLLFIGSWNFADDYGGLDRSPRQLKAQVFPYDNIEVEPLIQELIGQGIFIEYEVEFKKYLHISGFGKHQKIEKPSKPRIPLFDQKGNTRRPFTEDSPTSSGSSLGMEGNGMEVSKNARAREVPRGTVDVEDATMHTWAETILAEYPKAPHADLISAEKAIRRAIEDGDAFSTLLDGTKRYAAYCAATGRLVANPARWYADPAKPWRSSWEIPAMEPAKKVHVGPPDTKAVREQLAKLLPNWTGTDASLAFEVPGATMTDVRIVREAAK